MSRCWLCEYNKDPEAIRMSRFLIENASNMGIEQMAKSVHERLAEVDPHGNGHSIEDVKEHIKLHIVTPTIKISCMLRALIALMDKLEDSLMDVKDDGTPVVDSKNVAVYLKVVSEIMQIYRSGDLGRMTFAEHTQAFAFQK